MSFDLGSVIATVKADVSDFKRGLESVKQQASSLNSHFSGVSGGLKSAISSVGSFMVDTFQKAVQQTKFLLAGIGAGLAFAGKRALDVAGDLQQAQSAYETLLGSAEEAESAIQKVKQDAAKTPFDMRELIRGNQMLISTGESVDASRKAVLDLGNAIVATGGGNAEFTLMTANLQQIKNLGKASAMDIKQFGMAGINIYGLLAESTGKSVAELKDSEVTYEDLTQALSKAAGEGGMFAGALEKQANNWNLVKSNLQDVINIVLADIVTETGIFAFLNENLIKFVDWLTNNKDNIVGFFNRIGDAINGFITLVQSGDLTGDFLRAIGLFEDDEAVGWIMKIADAFRALGGWISENKETVITFLQGLAIALGALLIIGTIVGLITALTNPIVLVTGAIALLYTAWQQNWLGIQEITTFGIQILTDLFQGFLMPLIMWLVEGFRQNWGLISSTVQLAWALIVGIVKTASAVLLAVLFTFLAIFTGRWDIAWNYIKNATSVAWESIKGIFNAGLGFIKNWGGAVFNALTKPFRDAWNTIQDLVNKIRDKMDFTKRHSPSIVDIVNRGVGEVNKAMAGLDFSPVFNSLPTSSDFENAFSGINANSSIINQSNVFNVNNGVDARSLSERLAFDLRNS